MALSKPTIWILLFIITEIFVFYILTLLLSAPSCTRSVIQDLDAYLVVFSDHRLKYDLEFFCRLGISQCTANTPLIVVTVKIRVIWNKREMFAYTIYRSFKWRKRRSTFVHNIYCRLPSDTNKYTASHYYSKSSVESKIYVGSQK